MFVYVCNNFFFFFTSLGFFFLHAMPSKVRPVALLTRSLLFALITFTKVFYTAAAECIYTTDGRVAPLERDKLLPAHVVRLVILRACGLNFQFVEQQRVKERYPSLTLAQNLCFYNFLHTYQNI